jgi:hypothetical protein
MFEELMKQFEREMLIMELEIELMMEELQNAETKPNLQVQGGGYPADDSGGQQYVSPDIGGDEPGSVPA